MIRFYTRVCVFIIGICFGALLAIKCIINPKNNIAVKYSTPSYQTWFSKQGLLRQKVSWDSLRYGVLKEGSTEADFLYKHVTILCIILVYNQKNAQTAKETWAKGCNNIMFIELSKPKPMKRTKESSSWVLLCQNLINLNREYDWVLIVIDNTFGVLENLRYYVAHLNSSERFYLGHAVSFWSTVYNSKDAGYVLSKGTLTAFKKGFTESDCLKNIYWNREDFYLGKYLAQLNITPVDTKDSEGLSLFHPYNWYQIFFPSESYYKTSIFTTKCCSKFSITFKAIERDKMYMYYYFLYRLQVFSSGHLGNMPYMSAIPDDQVWKSFLKERNVHNENISSKQYYKIWEDLIEDPYSFAAHMKKELYFNYD